MIAYTIGIVCTLSVVTLLRLGRLKFCGIILLDASRNHRNTPTATSRRDHEGFQYSWRVSSNELFIGSYYRSNNNNDACSEETELQTPLLRRNENDNCGYLRDNSVPNWCMAGTPFESLDFAYNPRNIPDGGVLPWWKRVLLYELALLSTLLWLPTMFLPLFQLKYGGIMSDFMSETSLSIRLWDFPTLLWGRGVSAGADQFILVIFESIILLLVFACPIIANGLAIGAWTCDDKSSRMYCKNLLWIIQPFLCSIIFSIALYFSIPVFEEVIEYVLDTYSFGICEKFEVVTTGTCFTIQGESLAGLWLMLVEAFALELFVVFTLVSDYT